METKILRPFGPSIMYARIPDKLVNDLNEYVDQTAENKNKINELNYGSKLAADVTQEFKLERGFAKKVGWLDFLGKCTQAWIKREINKDIKKFSLIESWIVRQYKNEYNPTHYHAGHISGAGFLKVPKNFGDFSQEKEKTGKIYPGGKLNLIHGSRMFLSESSIFVEPEVGAFYFFPHYLMHSVYPFKESDEERRSISFNAFIDEEIFNVFKD
tara:strand:- start:72 stop:710 length:639 start_codon:yes stop_codon:yes gene_type:complete